MSVPSWNASLPATAQRGLAWQFATTYVERLSANMRRLRLSGVDPILVADKAWQETWILYESFCNRTGAVSGDMSVKGFQMVLCHHAYGPALVQLMQWRRAKPEYQDDELLIFSTCTGPCPFQGEDKGVLAYIA